MLELIKSGQIRIVSYVPGMTAKQIKELLLKELTK